MDNIIYKSTPIGSLVTQPENVAERYITRLATMPPSLRNLLMSANTGAFIRGLAKSHALDASVAPIIAYSILKIAFGDTPLTELPSALTTDLQIPTNFAQKIADEITRDLFTPIQNELNSFLANKNTSTSNTPHQETAQQAPKKTSPQLPHTPQNILNLKELPAKPFEKVLPAPKKPTSSTSPSSKPSPTPSARQFPLPPKINE